MKLSKAIEVIDLNIQEAHKKMPPDVMAALQLLVETAKVVQAARKGNYLSMQELLPGEDPE